VLAISGAARGDFPLVVFGLLLSLPLVVWGSGLLANLMDRFPVVIWLGGGLLGWVAMQLVFEDPLVAGWLGSHADAGRQWVPWLAGAFVAILGWRFARTRAARR
jgi:predicted tellurium resistance membrane protein TerC